ARPGDWIVTLGGWSEEQFTDEPRGFPLEELDRVAPNNPVVLQAVYNHSYLNTAALKGRRSMKTRPIRAAAESRETRAASRRESSGMRVGWLSWRPRFRCRIKKNGSRTRASWWRT